MALLEGNQSLRFEERFHSKEGSVHHEAHLYFVSRLPIRVQLIFGLTRFFLSMHARLSTPRFELVRLCILNLHMDGMWV